MADESGMLHETVKGITKFKNKQLIIRPFCLDEAVPRAQLISLVV